MGDLETFSREQLVALAGGLQVENARLAEENARLSAGAAAQAAEQTRMAAENARLAEQVGQLVQANAELAAKVDRLEHFQSRNSRNSHMRPSRDDEPGRTPPQDAPAPGDAPEGGAKKRKRGKQPGAPAACLEWDDDPDGRIDHFPSGACRCGADLAGAADLGVVASHQEIEIPEVAATRTQHDLHAVHCGCGKVHTAPRPEGVGPQPVGYGINIKTFCVYLLAAHALPVERCAEVVAAMAGAAPSAGFVHGLLARAARAVAVSNTATRALVLLAHAVSCDETPLRVGPKKSKDNKTGKKYLLVACTELYTSFLLGDRSLGTFQKSPLPDLAGVVVHDRYQNYDSAAFHPRGHQLCTQHLTRDLEDAAERHPGARWPRQAQEALRGLVHAANTARAAGADAIEAELRDRLAGEFRSAVKVGLSEVAPAPRGSRQPPGRVLLEVLRDREGDVLRFAYDLRVPPTSNLAERDLRPSKTQENTSGRLPSEEVTRHRYDIKGYLSTAAKHGVDKFRATRDALLGRAWMPPVPDLA